MLQPLVFPDHEAMSRYAADRMAERLRSRPDALFCLATGATPLRAYSLLVERRAAEPHLFDRLRVIKLDEWGGLPMEDRATCESHLRSVLIDPLAIGERYVAFHSRPSDPDAECRRVARWLEQCGPIDVCVLGLGVNGHVGFNEPGPSLWPHAHVAQLSEASLGHAMLNLSNNRPSYGLTLGMADLLHARHLLVLVSGSTKVLPLEQLLTGSISTSFPASLLSLHVNIELLCDRAARPEQPDTLCSVG
jgi:galactosamine-6-phosphate isomerase